MVTKGRIWTGDILNKKKSGEVFPVHASVYGLSEAKGEHKILVGFQEDITERKEMEKELNRRTSELKHLSGQLRRAREIERAAIARELHDEFGQALTAVKINLSRLENELKDLGSRESMERMWETGQLADRLLEQVRDLALNLRPSMLDDLGLSAALKWYMRGITERTGIECGLSIEGHEWPLSGDKRTMVYRAVQEALTNVARHSQAKNVGISLRFGADNLTVEVKDDGKGFSVKEVFNSRSERSRLGLVGMRESVEELGGNWSIESSPKQGTSLSITIPQEDPRCP